MGSRCFEASISPDCCKKAAWFLESVREAGKLL